MYDKITYEIIGAAIKVFKALGYGYPESDYATALCFELKQIGYKVIKEYRTNFTYNNIVLRKKRIDILVNDEVVVELKINTPILPGHINQVIGYLKQTKLKKGLILYFNQNGVTPKHIVN